MPYDRIVYYPGSTDQNVYTHFTSKSDGTIWNGTDLVTWVNADVADYAVAADFLGGGRYGVTVPTDLPDGDYVASHRTGDPPTLTDLKLPDEWEFHWAGVASPVVPPGTPASDYLSSYDKFIRKFGESSIIELSNKDDTNPTTVNTLAVQDAFDFAYAEINKQMRGGPYGVPLAFSGDVDPVVEEWLMTIAYAYLYYGRWEAPMNVADGEYRVNPNPKRISSLQAQVYGDMALVKAGLTSISATADSTYDNGMAVVVNGEILDPTTLYNSYATWYIRPEGW